MMYEKILQKLKSQRGDNSQVTDQTLEVKAKSLANIITDDDTLAKIDFTEEIKSMQGNIGKIAADAVKNADDKAKKEAEKKAAEEKARKDAEEKAKKDGETTDPVVAELLEQNKKIMEQLQNITTEKTTQSREVMLAEKIKDTPLIFKNATTKAFKRMNFETEEAFNDYLSEIETSAKEAIQIGQESGLSFATPTKDINKPDPDEVSPEMQKTIDEITENKEEKKPF